MWLEARNFDYGLNAAAHPKKSSIFFLIIVMHIGCFSFFASMFYVFSKLTSFASKLQEEIEYVQTAENNLQTYIKNIVLQQEQIIQRQNFVAQNLMSQAEVLFNDLQMISDNQEAQLVQVKNKRRANSKSYIGESSCLRKDTEYSRRRAENINRELWFYIHDQLKQTLTLFETLSNNLEKAVFEARENIPPKENITEVNEKSRSKNATASTKIDVGLSKLKLGGAENRSSMKESNGEVAMSVVLAPSLPKVRDRDVGMNNTKDKKKKAPPITPNVSSSVSNLGKLRTRKYKKKEQSSFNRSETVERNSSISETENLERAQRQDEEYLTQFLLVQNSVSMLKNKFLLFKDELAGYRRALLQAFSLLKNAGGAEKHRMDMSQKLGGLVQRRLKYLQQRKHYEHSETLKCRDKACGFGCRFHNFIYCLIIAYASNTPVVGYPPSNWQHIFAPLREPSNANTTVSNKENIEAKGDDNRSSVLPRQVYSSRIRNLHIVDEPSTEDIPYLPLNIPEDLATQLAIFHGNPPAWWVGQIATYLFRPTKYFAERLNDTTRKLGYTKPIVGVHIRRTDKISSEADFHELEEYMVHVEDYFDQLERSTRGVTRQVFLATDDSNLLIEAENKYPRYKFISDNNSSKFTVEERNLPIHVEYIATDIYLLSRSDFLVCTFSSQVCRLAYELMQGLHGDASQKFRSLDDVYYFGGQQLHMMKAIEAHKPRPGSENTLDLQEGDIIEVAGNHWNGFSKGTSKRSFQTGLYPSYKVEDLLFSVKMASYKNLE